MSALGWEIRLRAKNAGPWDVGLYCVTEAVGADAVTLGWAAMGNEVIYKAL